MFVPVARPTQPLRTDYSVMLYCAFGKTRDLSQFVPHDIETEASHVMLCWREKQVPRHPTRTLLRNTYSCLTRVLRDMEAVASHATLSIWEGGSPNCCPCTIQSVAIAHTQHSTTYVYLINTCCHGSCRPLSLIDIFNYTLPLPRAP